MSRIVALIAESENARSRYLTGTRDAIRLGKPEFQTSFTVRGDSAGMPDSAARALLAVQRWEDEFLGDFVKEWWTVWYKFNRIPHCKTGSKRNRSC